RFRQAADQGNDWGQSNLGLCYLRGYGVKADPDEAVKWLSKGAGQGNLRGQFLLGNCCADGKGVKQDPEKAVRLWKLAADQGDEEARKALAAVERHSGAIPPEAERLYRQDAEAGVADAQYLLGWAYVNGQMGVTRDYKLAVLWLKKAEGQEHAAARDILGTCYLNGWGLDKADYVEAVRLYRLAAKQGNLWARTDLGFCYLKGYGVDKDEKEAVRLFRQAA